MMEPLVANPAATKPVLYRKSLRLGVFAFIGFLPDEARSPIRIDVAIIERPVQILGPASSNLKAKPGADRTARLRQQSLCVMVLRRWRTLFAVFCPNTDDGLACAGGSRTQLPQVRVSPDV